MKLPHHPSEPQLRRAEALSGPRPGAAPPHPRLRLLDWRPIGKGAVIGRARVLLRNGLEISDIGLFAKDGRIWAHLPAQQQRDGNGRPITDDRGKSKYVSSIRWSTKELQDGFSRALIDVLREQFPDALDGVR